MVAIGIDSTCAMCRTILVIKDIRIREKLVEIVIEPCSVCIEKAKEEARDESN
jgi:hypothetical protein